MSFKVYFDNELVKTSEQTQRNLLVELNAKNSPTKYDTKKAPLNLALVIDVSTTMRGSRMENAKAAAIGLIGSLSRNDHLSIVSLAKTFKPTWLVKRWIELVKIRPSNSYKI